LTLSISLTIEKVGNVTANYLYRGCLFNGNRRSCGALKHFEGSVQVNGETVTADKDVVAGDRVKVLSGAAKIVYDNGAIVNIGAGQTAVVLQTPPDPPVQASNSGSDADNCFSSSDPKCVLGVLAGGAGVGLAVALSGAGNGGSQVSGSGPFGTGTFGGGAGEHGPESP
jgi:hypothetical protein